MSNPFALRCEELAGHAGKGMLERSALYREFQAEREEILQHKWFESEKAGRDVGFENALVSWVLHHRAEWRKRRRSDRAMICTETVSNGKA